MILFKSFAEILVIQCLCAGFVYNKLFCKRVISEFFFQHITHQNFCLFFLQVKARLAQAWQAINQISASEGVLLYSHFMFHLIWIFPYLQNCSSSEKLYTEHFQTWGQQPCKFLGTKKSVYVRKAAISLFCGLIISVRTRNTHL